MSLNLFGKQEDEYKDSYSMEPVVQVTVGVG